MKKKVKLTRKKAIELCIELWTWLAETGKKKDQWPEWDKYGGYWNVMGGCFFCEYDKQFKDACQCCPLVKMLKIKNGCYSNRLAYVEWEHVKTIKARKKYAALFLSQIKELR